jgi:prepilin-type N-terminal cleavage/methylation domain-containing protein
MKKLLRATHNQAGFTILELMIATLVFSVILVVITAGVLHFTTDYYKGINSSTTQNAAANIMSDISQSIQFNRGVPPHGTSGTSGWLCAGGKEYVYFLGQEEPNVNSGLFSFGYDGINCYTSANYATAPTWLAGHQDLLQSHMRLSVLSVSGPTGPNANIWNINVGVAYGDNDLFCAPVKVPGSCSTGLGAADFTNLATLTDLRCISQNGSQFCGVANLSTTVQSRL